MFGELGAVAVDRPKLGRGDFARQVGNYYKLLAVARPCGLAKGELILQRNRMRIAGCDCRDSQCVIHDVGDAGAIRRNRDLINYFGMRQGIENRGGTGSRVSKVRDEKYGNKNAQFFHGREYNSAGRTGMSADAAAITSRSSSWR